MSQVLSISTEVCSSYIFGDSEVSNDSPAPARPRFLLGMGSERREATAIGQLLGVVLIKSLRAVVVRLSVVAKHYCGGRIN